MTTTRSRRAIAAAWWLNGVLLLASEANASVGGGGGCVDSHEHCDHWRSIGECDANPGYMLTNCKRSCSTCSASEIATSVHSAVQGTPQDLSGVWWLADSAKEEFLSDVESYMIDEVWSRPTYATVRSACANGNEECSRWALEGQCDAFDVRMKCGPACKACDFLDEDVRCGERTEDALAPGSVDAMSRRIVDSSEDWDAEVHSRPGPDSDEPWIVTIDNFVTDEEIDRLLEYGERTGYTQSGETFGGDHKGSKTTEMRTSENSWCGFQFGDTCYDDPVVRGLLDRVSLLTSVPAQNYHEMQILRYTPGQFYKTHGDYIVQDAARRHGGRVLTLLLYLSDVEQGGETEFPRLDPPVRVAPKRGRALLWANVRDDDPTMEDERTWHQALPVVEGTKRAANLWMHMRGDVRKLAERKCLG